MAFKNAQSPVGIHLLKADDLQTWFLSIKVLGDSLYQGEVFALKFVFEQNYPIEAPQVSILHENLI
jgi:ubiquitin-conjugating enzyme E2 W